MRGERREGGEDRERRTGVDDELGIRVGSHLCDSDSELSQVRGILSKRRSGGTSSDHLAPLQLCL